MAERNGRINGEKYMTYKQFTAWGASMCCAAIVGGWIVMQAHASEPHDGVVTMQVAAGIQAGLDKMLAAMKTEKISRKTALELKKVREGLTPEEEVELQGLKEVLKSLSGGG